MDVPGSVEAAWDPYWRHRPRTGPEQPGALTCWSVPILRAAQVRRVVDLGCGPGHDLCFLLREGFEDTGVDRSSVAIDLAREALGRLPDPPPSRGRISRDGALEFLRRQAAGSVEAVHPAATYGATPDDDLRLLFDEVHRVLTPGGLHLWSARGDRHPLRARPEYVPPNRSGAGVLVPIRFLSRAQVDQLTAKGFERIRFTEIEEASSHSFFLADRRARMFPRTFRASPVARDPAQIPRPAPAWAGQHHLTPGARFRA